MQSAHTALPLKGQQPGPLPLLNIVLGPGQLMVDVQEGEAGAYFENGPLDVDEAPLPLLRPVHVVAYVHRTNPGHRSIFLHRPICALAPTFDLATTWFR